MDTVRLLKKRVVASWHARQFTASAAGKRSLSAWRRAPRPAALAAWSGPPGLASANRIRVVETYLGPPSGKAGTDMNAKKRGLTMCPAALTMGRFDTRAIEGKARMSLGTRRDQVLVTGATGLLGSHLAERLIARGRPVRALVRPGSKTDFLDSLGVEIVRGDLTDHAACKAAVAGVARVFHCAAKVGDWGRWREFQTGCIDATRILAQAAAVQGIDRFIHISSTSAYGHPAEGQAPIDESAPLGQNVWVLDYYTRSKVDCERVLWELAGAGLPLTVIRPSWLFGERDRTTVPRLVREFRRGRVLIVGKGDNPLERRLCRSRGRRRHSGGGRSGLARRGVQHHQPGPDHPARVSRHVRRCA